ncbi:hypothetical protein P4K96_16650, partial [Bacillus cereus]|nr:hypothetical protein [Bacillus cereus]
HHTAGLRGPEGPLIELDFTFNVSIQAFRTKQDFTGCSIFFWFILQREDSPFYFLALAAFLSRFKFHVHVSHSPSPFVAAHISDPVPLRPLPRLFRGLSIHFPFRQSLSGCGHQIGNTTAHLHVFAVPKRFCMLGASGQLIE